MPFVAFVGKVTIDADNDTVYWEEQVSGSMVCSVAHGEYWPEQLASELTTKMNAVSVNNTYRWDFYTESGRYVCELDSGSENWRFRLADSLTGKCLTGGDSDSYGSTWLTGQYGHRFLGWEVNQSVPFDVVSEPEHVAGHCWYPEEQTASDPGWKFPRTSVSGRDAGGKVSVYTLEPWKESVEEFEEAHGGLFAKRSLGFQLLKRPDKRQYERLFWGPYASQGGIFRLYIDRTKTNFFVCILGKSSREINDFNTRTKAYQYWSGFLNIERAAE